jgi:hypothetical protein
MRYLLPAVLAVLGLALLIVFALGSAELRTLASSGASPESPGRVLPYFMPEPPPPGEPVSPAAIFGEARLRLRLVAAVGGLFIAAAALWLILWPRLGHATPAPPPPA